MRHITMRTLAVMLLASALAAACAVPDVTFAPGDASSLDGTSDASVDPADSGDEGEGDDAGDPEDASDATDPDASVADDAAGEHSPADARYDGPFYCSGAGSKPPPGGGKCCPMNGGPCYGGCNGTECAACGTCTSPRVCCTSGSTGVCQMPPCADL